MPVESSSSLLRSGKRWHTETDVTRDIRTPNTPEHEQLRRHRGNKDACLGTESELLNP